MATDRLRCCTSDSLDHLDLLLSAALGWCTLIGLPFVEPHTQIKVPKCAKCITFLVDSVDSCAALQADCGRISCFAILCYKKDAHGTKPNGAFIAELQLCVRVDCECLIDVTSNFSP
jgi:hypothetical protein